MLLLGLVPVRICVFQIIFDILFCLLFLFFLLVTMYVFLHIVLVLCVSSVPLSPVCNYRYARCFHSSRQPQSIKLLSFHSFLSGVLLVLMLCPSVFLSPHAAPSFCKFYCHNSFSFLVLIMFIFIFEAPHISLHDWVQSHTTTIVSSFAPLAILLLPFCTHTIFCSEHLLKLY